MNIEKLIRNNIRSMKPYSSARHEYTGTASLYLDANENPYPSEFNRYPDPSQTLLKQKISRIKGIPEENIFVGNGSDEAIDLLIRIFCEPGHDNIIVCPPTYGMYEVCAEMNDVRIKKVPLNSIFQLSMKMILPVCDSLTKIIFICSPNNPSGNIINRSDIEKLLETFPGIIVVDEAYIDYSTQNSFAGSLNRHPNLVVLQTLSKAWGLAGLRLGMAFASKEIIRYLDKVKYPYNINSASQEIAMASLEDEQIINHRTKLVIDLRNRLTEQLRTIPFVKKIFPSQANFILVKMENAGAVYDHLAKAGIIVRNKSKDPGCKECLRITVGTPGQNDQLIKALKTYVK